MGSICKKNQLTDFSHHHFNQLSKILYSVAVFNLRYIEQQFRFVIKFEMQRIRKRNFGKNQIKGHNSMVKNLQIKLISLLLLMTWANF